MPGSTWWTAFQGRPKCCLVNVRAHDHGKDGVGALSERRIDRGLVGIVEFALVHIGHYTDHLPGLLCRAVGENDFFADRVHVAKGNFRHGLVDHDDLGSVGVVTLIEITSAMEPCLQGGEVSGIDVATVGFVG